MAHDRLADSDANVSAPAAPMATMGTDGLRQMIDPFR